MKKAPVKVDWDIRQELNIIKNKINSNKGFTYLKDQSAVIRFLIERYKKSLKCSENGSINQKEVLRK